ncbi:alpha-1,2-fucosyltransferase [Flavobacterium sandaracinum]|uniref:Alpha-1,2-fucosyltransferase n=1 Tax=Flavobacterium sandaracinum TaxID=2541733 RepID=A0A4R5CRP2_9FLAO|nr:alpha-1,2-fucosyltransferase [Flavobacterium sandaracinum]TDE02040.1 alpha-1,2-fucosyltransferase [Flavobacterium sandaracinum]
MLTFLKLGSKGNLGNQLFQISSVIGLACKHKHDFAFPYWKYECYFDEKLPLLVSNIKNRLVEKKFSYHDWEIENEDYNIDGWLQSEKYFSNHLTKIYFNFEYDFKQKIYKKYKVIFEKKVILISIRRGDFTNNPDFYQPTLKYYYSALIYFFKDWQDRNIIFISDDLEYCKFHFDFLKNAFFATDLNDIEQLCLGSMCDDFIISNSTFSWWVAWLGEKTNSRVIRPERNFIGQLGMKFDETDFFPERWLVHSYKQSKLELKNVVFIINLDDNLTINKKFLKICLNYISEYFVVTILLRSNKKKKLQFFLKEYDCKNQNIIYTDKPYHEAIEQLISKEFEIFINWDYKIFIPAFRILYSINLIETQNEQIVGLSNDKIKYLQWYLHKDNFEAFNDLGSFLNFYLNKNNNFAKKNTIFAFHKKSNWRSFQDLEIINIEGFQFSFNKIYGLRLVFIYFFSTVKMFIKMNIKMIIKK